MPDRSFSATVDAAGRATITITPTKGRPWIVSQVSTELDGAPSGAAAFLRKNGNLVTVMVAAGDVADGAPSIPLQVGDRMTVEWTGCTAGQVAKATAFFEEGT